MTFAPFFFVHTTSFISPILGYSVDMSSNPMKMYLMCVSQYLCEKWLLPQ